MRLRALLAATGLGLVLAAPASAATFTVTGTADSASGTCTGGSCTTIRAALAAAAANGAGADTITLPAGNYQLSQTAGGQLNVNSAVTITGAAANTTKIAGDGKNFRIFNVTATATIGHLRATFGTAVTAAQLADRIGGIVLVDAGGNLTLDHAWIDSGQASRGGGIAIRASTATITKSLVTANHANQTVGVADGDGGGILVLGGSTLALTDSTVNANVGRTASGIESTGSTSNSVTITRSSIVDNNTASSTNSGNGLNTSGGTFRVGGSIVADNSGDSVQDNCTSGITSLGGNVETTSACGFTQASDRQDVDNSNLQLVPDALVAAGETEVLPIPATSVAVGLAGTCTGADQRDLPRPQGVGCDAGAYEVDQVPDTSITNTPPNPTTSSSPAFSFTSPEPGVTFECSLSTGAASYSACASPKTYPGVADGTYTFSVRAVDGTGHTDASPATYTFRIDTTPPDTTITSGPSGPVSATSATFAFSSEANATFTCTLTGPGQSGTPVSCTSPKAYSGLAQGAFTFSVYATDQAGLADPSPATRSFTVDTVAPTATINSGPSGLTNSSAPSFGFTSSETSSTFQCKLDGPGTTTGTFAACTSPKAYSALADGAYTFSVRATDAALNQGAAATRSFTVDTVAPTTTINSGPSGLIATNAASFTFSGSEGGTFACALSGPGQTGAFSACTSPKAYSGLANGSFTFSVRETDTAGNQGAAATRSFSVDTVAPDTAIGSGPSGPTNNASPSFAFTSAGGTSFECALSGPGQAGTFAACTSPKGYAGLADGAYTFQVRARDSVGNTDPSPATSQFTVDTSAPPADVVSGPSGPTTDAAPAFGFTSDAGTTFECRLDGPGGQGAFGACTSPKTFAGLAPGAYTFFLRATDGAGNQSTTSRSFSVAVVQQATPTPTPTPTPSPAPTPVPGKSVVIQPVRGRTLVKLPGSSNFVPVDVTIGIPLGSTVDTRKSEIRLFSIPKPGKPAESALFYDGIFKVTQAGGITQLELVETLAKCPTGKAAAAAAAKKPKTRKLWGDGTGSFRTRGQYSAATVRGTKWLVQDSCGKTLTRVARGVVSVQDFVKHKTLLLRAPHSYTARKKR